MSGEDINTRVSKCARCPLRVGATQPVPGLGDAPAKYLIIGEAPGREEDRGGMPFVGQSGRRLNQLLEVANIDINDCYITNVCKCRPPNNRTPRKAEVRACLPYLIEEIKLVKPKYIIALGTTPLLLFNENPVSQMHGTMFDFNLADRFVVFRNKKKKKKKTDLDDSSLTSVGERRVVKVISQYHPAACLHQPALRSTLIDDWENLPQQVPHDYIVIEKPPSVFTGVVALDTENAPDGNLGQWSIAQRDKSGKLKVSMFYGPRKDIRFENAEVVMHNAKWDKRVLAGCGMRVPPNVVDTMIAGYCLGFGKQNVAGGVNDTGLIGGLGLKYLARRHLGMEMHSWNEVKDKPELIPAYNASDSLATLLLWERWRPKLPRHFWEIDMPLLDVLMAMEDRGISVNPTFLNEFNDYLDKRLGEFKLPLNPYSPAQVAKYVYTDLGIKPWKFTKGGQPSTEEEVLETIDDPIVKQILEYRQLSKEKNTYVKRYIDRITPDGRIHTEFKQTSTATGRLSSANPNLQNVPKNNSEIRKLFVAPKGKLLVRMDFSQLELRVFAALTGDKVMLEAFEKGRDIHQETSDFLRKRGFNISRYDAKTINFLMLYGGSAYKISSVYHVSIDEASALLRAYYDQFPAIEAYQSRIIEEARETKRVSTYVGRERRIDALYAEDWRVRQHGERMAVNLPVQGGAGEIVKIVMIDLHYKHKAPMLVQVHDELIFEVDEKQARDYAQWIKEYVPTITDLNGVRFPVEVGIGKNWLEAIGEEK